MSQDSAAAVFLDAQRQRIDQFLTAQLQETYGSEAFIRLRAAMRYSLLSGGKRLRPALCLAVLESFQVNTDAMLQIASALELIHAYSLIHDDLPCMDDDDLRHGKPTNHLAYDEATALLAGDALLTLAFDWLSIPTQLDAGVQLQMIKVLAQAAGVHGMVGGQMADMAAEGVDGSLAVLAEIHAHKTGKLIQAAVIMGGLAAGVSEQTSHGLRIYGDKLGLLFQIVDDILDVTGTTEELGKQVGADEALQKLTYPRLVGVEAALSMADEAYQAAVDGLHAYDIDAPLLESIAEFVRFRRK